MGKDREALEIYLKQNFLVEKVADDLKQWIRDWFAQNGPESVAVIGLSGGKDSALVATLCKAALGRDRVFAVLMPDHTQSDIEVSLKIARWLDIPYAQVNIGEATDAVKASLERAQIQNSLKQERECFEKTPQMLTNIAPRIRMTTLYAIAQSRNGRVSNNCNRSERYVGYSTIFGDAAGDFSPISDLTVTEIIALGRYLGMPEEFITKAPSDGLTGKTDEDNFGFTYEELDAVILTGKCENPESAAAIEKRHAANVFKLRPMPAFKLRKGNTDAGSNDSDAVLK